MIHLSRISHVFLKSNTINSYIKVPKTKPVESNSASASPKKEPTPAPSQPSSSSANDLLGLGLWCLFTSVYAQYS